MPIHRERIAEYLRLNPMGADDDVRLKAWDCPAPDRHRHLQVPTALDPCQLAPASGPHSWPTRPGNLIFLAGTAAVDPDGKLVGEGDIRTQTQATLENLTTAVTAAGGTIQDIVKTTVYVGDGKDYAGMNEVYRSYFPEGPPARATLLTGFVVPGLLVEIEAIAALD